MTKRYTYSAGQKFGRLTLIEFVRLKPQSKWRCICDCGNETFVRATCLGKFTNSCGCLHRERLQKYFGNEASIRHLYRSYKVDAKLRNYEFNLSYDDFCFYTSANCFYCDAPPSRVHKQARNSTAEPYICNGMDRKDSNKGYFPGNILPCCQICNRMKMSLDFSVFVEQCKKIANRFEEENGTSRC